MALSCVTNSYEAFPISFRWPIDRRPTINEEFSFHKDFLHKFNSNRSRVVTRRRKAK